ncbi:hypothetical protein [Piscirickettsia salmonis]|uniref:hypothetical protein n=1 Tax=Piscirickettsia salmonis TaxID=1238 RepID=UPI003A803EE0
MDNQAPSLKQHIQALHQVSRIEWCPADKPGSKAKVCLVFNTDLTDHIVKTDEKSMWPTKTHFITPKVHAEDCSGLIKLDTSQ